MDSGVRRNVGLQHSFGAALGAALAWGRGGLRGIVLAEEDVVDGVGVEGRIEVDEVDGLIGDVVTEDGEVVSEVEFVGGRFVWGWSWGWVLVCRSVFTRQQFSGGGRHFHHELRLVRGHSSPLLRVRGFVTYICKDLNQRVSERSWK